MRAYAIQTASVEPFTETATTPGVAPGGQDPHNPPMTQPDRLSKLLIMLDADPGDAFCLYGIAQEHAGNGEHETALEWYAKAAVAAPDDGYVHFHRARSLEDLGRVDEAITAVRDGLAAAERSGDAHAQSELNGLLESLST